MKGASLCLLAAALVAPVTVDAASLTVAPTTVTLTSDNDIGTIFLSNPGDAPIAAQVQGFAWSQADGSDRLTPSDGIVISPPIVTIAPGQMQTVRFKANSGASRLLVSELPSPDRQTEGITLLMQFSIPIFVGQGSASTLKWDVEPEGSGVRVTAENIGTRYEKLTKLDLLLDGQAIDGESRSGLFYVLAGSTQVWHFPSVHPPLNGRIDVVGHGDGDRHVEANLVLHR